MNIREEMHVIFDCFERATHGKYYPDDAVRECDLICERISKFLLNRKSEETKP